MHAHVHMRRTCTCTCAHVTCTCDMCMYSLSSRSPLSLLSYFRDAHGHGVTRRAPTRATSAPPRAAPGHSRGGGWGHCTHRPQCTSRAARSVYIDLSIVGCERLVVKYLYGCFLFTVCTESGHRTPHTGLSEFAKKEEKKVFCVCRI